MIYMPYNELMLILAEATEKAYISVDAELFDVLGVGRLGTSSR